LGSARHENMMLTQLPPVVRLENFLGEAVAGQILRQVVARQEEFQPSRIGSDLEGRLDLSFRVSKKLRHPGALGTEVELAVAEILPEVLAEMKIGRIQSYRLETELVWHGNGAFFKPHIDTKLYENNHLSSRVLSAVYYLHRKPKPFRGGQLRLYPLSPAEIERYRDVEPVSDSVVFFPSWFPHEVLPVHSDSEAFADGRFAVNCWVHKILFNP
jgi:SM-20-related protein